MNECLQVEFDIKSPVVFSGRPIHLDALLAFVAIHVAGYAKIPYEGREPSVPARLPLARMEFDEFWWYRASAVYPPESVSRQTWVKRFDDEHLDRLDLGRATRVDVACGQYRGYRVPIEAILVPTLRFWAVGDRRRVWSLARRLRHIGKKPAQGYGRIAACRVEVLPNDPAEFNCDWRAEANTPARNLPVGFAESKGLDYCGTMPAPVGPPYWRVLEENITEVALP